MKTLWRVGGGGGDDRTQVELVQTPLTHLRLRSRGAGQSNVITSGRKNYIWETIHKAGLLHFLTCSIARLWSCKFSTSPQSFKPPTSEVRVWLVNHVTGVNNWHSSYLVWRMAWWLTSTLILTFYNLQLQCNNGLIKPSNILATWLEEDDGLETSKLSWVNVQLAEP